MYHSPVFSHVFLDAACTEDQNLDLKRVDAIKYLLVLNELFKSGTRTAGNPHHRPRKAALLQQYCLGLRSYLPAHLEGE